MISDVAFFVISQEKEMKQIASEINAWFDKGKLIWRVREKSESQALFPWSDEWDLQLGSKLKKWFHWGLLKIPQRMDWGNFFLFRRS